MKLTLFLLTTTLIASFASGQPVKLFMNDMRLTGHINKLNARQMAPPTTLGTLSPDGAAVEDPSLSSSTSPSGTADETIHYRNQGPADRVQFGKCIPLNKENGDSVKFGKFAKPASCYAYKDNLCENLAFPFPVLLPSNVELGNPFNVAAEFIGAYICRSLDNEPLLKPAMAALTPVSSLSQQVPQPAALDNSMGNVPPTN
ncbi:hypothetical protein BCR42DRAFT_443808 [Absidia repens]|uniref:Uncharacterized protein n=1 Tax=Absidia repens TaxID=90262 RepID=A0A1X2HY96_9FUNG|nr:hypothetical protein BCR42DRAFT_443808 [Absidia repens]